MTSRIRSISLLVGTLALAGCAESLEPLRYVRNDRVAAKLKVKRALVDKVEKVIDDTFGTSPRDLKVPAGSGLPGGGIRLANQFVEADAKDSTPHQSAFLDAGGKKVLREGGYALYRRHCQHCHGSSGDGNGPTADFLFPRPRDYRMGLYKFTSTPYNQKPTRADLRKTIVEGLHGTSMPAFEALMTPNEIEQVIDYVVFLSMRGEVEGRLLNEVATADESDPDALSADVVKGHLDFVFTSWKDAEKTVVDTTVSRVEPSHASILRGRDLFWKNDCLGCHGPKAQGNGQSFIDQRIFLEVVFHNPSKLERYDDAEVLNLLLARKEGAASPDPLPKEVESVAGPAPWIKVATVLKRLETEGLIRRNGGEAPTPDASPGTDKDKKAAPQDAEPDEEVAARAARYTVSARPEFVENLRKERVAWLDSRDEWGNPLRPANLNQGSRTVYKGGRRPLDIYWRIAKGINGAKMPGHASQLEPRQIWDLVNFVLALPYEPQLVEGTPPPPETPATPPAKVAER